MGGFISYFTLNWLTFKFYMLFNEQNSVKLLKSGNNEENVLLIYNKIPKTGSTSFVHFTQHLSEENGFKMVLLNISHPHSMTLSDRQYFAKNISTWQEMFPAIYHGHFAYVDMQNLAVNTGDVKMVNINIVRNPFERMISYYYFLRYGDDSGKIRSVVECLTRTQHLMNVSRKGFRTVSSRSFGIRFPGFVDIFEDAGILQATVGPLNKPNSI